MQEKLSDAHRVLVEDISVVIGGNVHTVYEKLAVVDSTPAVLKVYAASADRFDLGADKLNACFKAFEDKIFVPNLAVFGNCLE